MAVTGGKSPSGRSRPRNLLTRFSVLLVAYAFIAALDHDNFLEGLRANSAFLMAALVFYLSERSTSRRS